MKIIFTASNIYTPLPPLCSVNKAFKLEISCSQLTPSLYHHTLSIIIIETNIGSNLISGEKEETRKEIMRILWKENEEEIRKEIIP